MYDIAIIGSGVGGYTAAEVAGKAGLRVVLFEKDELGGTCLNKGCIPTKTLLKSSHLYHEIQQGAEFGIFTNNVSFDFKTIHERKREVVSTLCSGVEKLMKQSNVDVVYGRAVVTDKHTIMCNGAAYEAKDIILATGSYPFVPPIEGSDTPGVYTSDDILNGDGIECDSLTIIGGGVIGVEIANFYADLGVPVTILEVASHILPTMDKDIGARLAMHLKKRGVRIETSIKISHISGKVGDLIVSYANKKGEVVSQQTQAVLMATGRRPVVDGVFSQDFEKSVPNLINRGFVADIYGKTNYDNFYVIGDAKAGNIQLAHVAEAQARNVIACILEKDAPLDVSVVPSCVYTSPEIASVGLNEQAAYDAGYKIKVGKFLTGANGKCLIEDAESGYVKLIFDEDTHELLGAQLVCPRATDLIAELALALQQHMTYEQMGSVIHPHPTFSEMIMGAIHALK
ncbi:MAG: dihydrolipoyl dehydrogenase [Eggerthellaceae bacterium]|nr:dihydrolipoyl dehydrogenase [Eggerthellaceae bacterium]